MFKSYEIWNAYEMKCIEIAFFLTLVSKYIYIYKRK